MSRINDMSVSSRFVDLQEIEKNGGATFKLQDKSVTENGTVIADPTYDGLSSVDVNVSGGSSSATAYAWNYVTTYGSDTTIGVHYFPTDVSPTDKDDYLVKCAYVGFVDVEEKLFKVADDFANVNDEYTRSSDTSFTVDSIDLVEVTTVYTRDSSKDFTLW